MAFTRVQALWVGSPSQPSASPPLARASAQVRLGWTLYSNPGFIHTAYLLSACYMPGIVSVAWVWQQTVTTYQLPYLYSAWFFQAP